MVGAEDTWSIQERRVKGDRGEKKLLDSIKEILGLPLWLSWWRICLQCGKRVQDPLKKGKATHSSILAWRIPWGRKEWDMTEHTCTHTHSPITILCSDWTVSRTDLTLQKCPWSGQGALLHSWLYPSWSLRAIQTGAHVTPPFVIAPTEFKTNDYKR